MHVVLFPSRSLVKWGLVTHLRTRRAFAMMAVFVLIAIVGTTAFWPTGAFQQLSSASAVLMTFASMLFLCGALFFIPGMAAVSITVEKEQDTFDQLWLTLVRPGGVIFAKLVNVLGVFFLFLIGAMPILGSIFFLVGVDWAQVAATFGIVTATGFSCAMAGILCSTYFRKSFVSIIWCYVAMVFLTGIPIYIALALTVFVLDVHPSITLNRAEQWTIQITSPVISMFILNTRGMGISSPLSPWWAILYQVFWGSACFLLARRMLMKPANPPKVELRKPIDDAAVLEKRRKQFPFYLIDPLRRKPSIEDRRNPMLIKELRWGVLGRAGWLIRVFYGAFIVYMMTAVIVIANMRSTASGETLPFMVVQMIVTVLVIPPLLANGMAKEYEMGNMDFLRSTLLTPYEIVVGKVWAGIYSLGPLLLASACAGLLMAGCILAEASPRELAYLFTGYGSLATCVVLSLGMGMFASMATRRTSSALIFSHFLTLSVYLGLPLAATISANYVVTPSWRFASSRAYEMAAAFLSPITAYICGTNPPRIRDYLGQGPINGYWLSNVMIFSLIGYWFLAVAVFRFSRSGMKD